MIVSRDREKLIQAVVYFVSNTKHCSRTKLFKLLNFLDFEHFRQTGRSVTGLSYDAWPQGPVPGKFNAEIEKDGEEDLAASVEVKNIRASNKKAVYRTNFKPKTEFNAAVFTNRELRIMEQLASMFRDNRSDHMSDFAHHETLPWQTIYANGKGNGKQIPYELAFRSGKIVSGDTIDPEEFEYRKDALDELVPAARGGSSHGRS